jgi:hypothetical protein
MKSRPTFLGVFLFFVALVALVHLFVHLAFYGTGYRGFAEKGITGLAIEGSDSNGVLPISEIILFLEWGLIFLGIVFVYAKHRIDLRKEYVYLSLLKQKKNLSGGTELDRFYDLLNEMKHFRLTSAAKVFDVDVEVIEDWAQSLEAGGVAELTYPRIGGPEIWLIEGASPKKNMGEEETENGTEEDKKIEKNKGVEKLKS